MKPNQMTAPKWLPIEIALALFLLDLVFSLTGGLGKFLDTCTAVQICSLVGMGLCVIQLFLSARML